MNKRVKIEVEVNRCFCDLCGEHIDIKEEKSGFTKYQWSKCPICKRDACDNCFLGMEFIDDGYCKDCYNKHFDSMNEEYLKNVCGKECTHDEREMEDYDDSLWEDFYNRYEKKVEELKRLYNNEAKS